MTDLRQAAQQALEALERADKDDFWREQRDAITALKAALEQPEQEPKHVVKSNGRHSPLLTHMMNKQDTTPPAAQPEQEPVPDALGHIGFQEWWDAVADGYEVNDFKKMRRAWNAALKHEAPPAAQRPWQGLTDEAIIEIAKQTQSAEPGREGYILPVSFARAIEAAHNIKEGT
jgi:hypothetical protein